MTLPFLRPALALGMVLGSQGFAAAHAILVKSTPPINGTVSAGPVDIVLSYNSRIDQARSRLTLIRADKTTEVVPLAGNDGVDTLKATLPLPEGTFTLRWQVLAVDGHITRGDVPFTVKKAP